MNNLSKMASLTAAAMKVVSEVAKCVRVWMRVCVCALYGSLKEERMPIATALKWQIVLLS
jgi:hypothetical protein